jgi:class 3 adenylate cyclase
MVTLAMPARAAGAASAVERFNAVVLFAELRGFTRMSDVLDAPLVLLLANDFFSLVADVVGSQGGEPLSVQNDALLAVFRRGAPSQSAQQAVRAARRIQGDFGALAEKWRRAYGLRAAVAQGLHLGETVLGSGGLRGHEQRMAIGDCVSVAHCVLRRARAGEFVMSDAVMGALSVEHLDLDAEPLPPLALGRRNPIRIYGVLLEERLDFT